MHRLFSPQAAKSGAELEIEGREAHHAINVLRVKRAESVTLLDGHGGEYVAVVQEVSRHLLRVTLKEPKKTERPPFQITLFQALPKGKAFETILQKATELGTYRIVPLFTERVVARTEKLEKWQWVAIDAMKQCGNPWMPLLEAPQKFTDALKGVNEFDLSLVGSLHAGRRHPREWFEQLGGDALATPSKVAVWVGPEGDFTPGEMEALSSAGVKPISLGRLVLRSDTAAIAALALINYELEFACIATKKS